MTTPEANKELKKPPLNEAARIVNSHFLQSPYEGKDWESVRKDLIKEFTVFITSDKQQLLKELMTPTDQFLTWKKDDGTEEVYLPVKVIQNKLEGLS